MAAAIDRCGITTMLTSRAFLTKAGLPQLPGMLFLEDVLQETSPFAKVSMLVAARLLPATLVARFFSVPIRTGRARDGDFLERQHRRAEGRDADAPQHALEHRRAPTLSFRLGDDDVVLGVLPFFHSFGFTVTLWLPLLVGFGAAYHPNPTDAKTIGELAAKYGATLLISTPTFCSAYIRKCQPEQFATLRLRDRRRRAAARADCRRIQGEVRRRSARGLRLHRDGAGRRGQRARRHGGHAARARGTVGRPLPGVSAKVVDPDTGEGPLVGKEGLLLVTGPNQMRGYLGEPELTRDALRDGWYVTGDIAAIDEDGFIRITDRLSRFSKIAGEMVPHMKVEERLQALLDEPHTCVVTSVPDAAKGERLVALYTDPDLPRAEGLGAALRLGAAEAVDSEARGPARRRSDPDARHREGRPARRPAGGCRTIDGAAAHRKVTTDRRRAQPIRAVSAAD